MSNAWANEAINIARDGITGYVIDGKDGARRSIYAGMFNHEQSGVPAGTVDPSCLLRLGRHVHRECL